MRWLRLLFALPFSALWSAPPLAQTPYATDPLLGGRLLVWVVQPAPPAQPTADQLRATLRESTAGDFGQTAGSVGQTAGSYGGSASDLPRSGAVAGQPAGAFGQSAGSFGQTAGSLGQTAGSYGVSAGALGASNVATASAATPDFLQATLVKPWAGLSGELHSDFPGLQVTVLAVSAADLGTRLAVAAGTHSLPDLLLSDFGVLGTQWQVAQGSTLFSLGSPFAVAQSASRSLVAPPPEALLLAGAPDPKQARAFVVWLRDGQLPHAESGWAQQLAHSGAGSRAAPAPKRVADSAAGPSAPSDADPDTQRAAKVAASAAEVLLGGGGIGAAADPAAAAFRPDVAQVLALAPQMPQALDGLTVRMDVLQVEANERLAVVALRGIVVSPAAFGVVHPLVVLRRQDDGKNGSWHVLQITADLPPELLREAFSSLRGATARIPAQGLVTPKGVTLASPPDGDQRARGLELWWDNRGEDDLLLVEWQTRAGAGWSGSHLFFVPDRDDRLQTRVPALFAVQPAGYRWRVWALGRGGTVTLSPFRQFSLLP